MTEQYYDVFISYNHNDKPQVSELVNELQQRFSIWFDKADMRFGEDWVRQVTDGLKLSGSCAVFVGKSGLGRGQLEEIEIAKKLNVRLFPVLLSGGSSGELFQNLRIPDTTIYVNLTGGINRETYDLLASAIINEPVGWDFRK